MSAYTVISSTNNYMIVIRSVEKGHGSIRENLVLQKNKVNYDVEFRLPFNISWGEGFQTEEPEIISIKKSNEKSVVPSEIEFIKLYIKQNFKD